MEEREANFRQFMLFVLMLNIFCYLVAISRKQEYLASNDANLFLMAKSILQIVWILVQSMAHVILTLLVETMCEPTFEVMSASYYNGSSGKF